MFLFYVDGSADHHYYTFSGIGVPEENWRTVFDGVKDFRSKLRKQYGIFIRKELHAWKFLSGRGRPSDTHLSKPTRATIFREALALLTSFEPLGVLVFNAALNNEDWAFERLLNRINRTMTQRSTKAILICDEGKEEHYTALCL